MNKILLLYICLFVPSQLNAADEWDKTEASLEAAFLIINTADWLQTRYIAVHPDIFHERNLILGRHSSKKHVDIYFALITVGHIVIAHLLPNDYRKAFQIATITLSSVVVLNNHAVGIRYEW